MFSRHFYKKSIYEVVNSHFCIRMNWGTRLFVKNVAISDKLRILESRKIFAIAQEASTFISVSKWCQSLWVILIPITINDAGVRGISCFNCQWNEWQRRVTSNPFTKILQTILLKERTTADKDDACDVSEDHTVIANSSRLGYHCDRLLFDRQNCWEESHKSYSYRLRSLLRILTWKKQSLMMTMMMVPFIFRCCHFCPMHETHMLSLCVFLVYQFRK